MMNLMFMNVILMVVIVARLIQLWIFACSVNVMVINIAIYSQKNYNHCLS